MDYGQGPVLPLYSVGPEGQCQVGSWALKTLGLWKARALTISLP